MSVFPVERIKVFQDEVSVLEERILRLQEIRASNSASASLRKVYVQKLMEFVDVIKDSSAPLMLVDKKDSMANIWDFIMSHGPDKLISDDFISETASKELAKSTTRELGTSETKAEAASKEIRKKIEGTNVPDYMRKHFVYDVLGQLVDFTDISESFAAYLSEIVKETRITVEVFDEKGYSHDEYLDDIPDSKKAETRGDLRMLPAYLTALANMVIGVFTEKIVVHIVSSLESNMDIFREVLERIRHEDISEDDAKKEHVQNLITEDYPSLQDTEYWVDLVLADYPRHFEQELVRAEDARLREHEKHDS